MERFCTKCGTLVSGDGAFCPECGTPLDSVVNLSKPAQSIPVTPVQPVQSVPVTPVQPVQSVPVTPVQPAQSIPVTPVQPVQQPGTYNTPGNYGTMPNYPQSTNVGSSTERTENMTVGQWIGTLIIGTWFGIISMIILLVWAFGDTPQPKKNWARALLVMQLISIALVIVLYICIFACAGLAMGPDMWEEIANSL